VGGLLLAYALRLKPSSYRLIKTKDGVLLSAWITRGSSLDTVAHSWCLTKTALTSRVPGDKTAS
jgi:hypothetical protein